jgi:hypothetical protein
MRHARIDRLQRRQPRTPVGDNQQQVLAFQPHPQADTVPAAEKQSPDEGSQGTSVRSKQRT